MHCNGVFSLNLFKKISLDLLIEKLETWGSHALHLRFSSLLRNLYESRGAVNSSRKDLRMKYNNNNCEWAKMIDRTAYVQFRQEKKAPSHMKNVSRSFTYMNSWTNCSGCDCYFYSNMSNIPCMYRFILRVFLFNSSIDFVLCAIPALFTYYLIEHFTHKHNQTVQTYTQAQSSDEPFICAVTNSHSHSILMIVSSFYSVYISFLRVRESV